MKPVFDHEKLDVYKLELAFLEWSSHLLEEIGGGGGYRREICDQFDRASLSALLNTAEGNGKRRGRSRAKFFDDARGSAIECAACLDALVAKRLVSEARTRPGKELLRRVVGILTKLIERFESFPASGARSKSSTRKGEDGITAPTDQQRPS